MRTRAFSKGRRGRRWKKTYQSSLPVVVDVEDGLRAWCPLAEVKGATSSTEVIVCQVGAARVSVIGLDGEFASGGRGVGSEGEGEGEGGDDKSGEHGF